LGLSEKGGRGRRRRIRRRRENLFDFKVAFTSRDHDARRAMAGWGRGQVDHAIAGDI